MLARNHHWLGLARADCRPQPIGDFTRSGKCHDFGSYRRWPIVWIAAPATAVVLAKQVPEGSTGEGSPGQRRRCNYPLDQTAADDIGQDGGYRTALCGAKGVR